MKACWMPRILRLLWEGKEAWKVDEAAQGYRVMAVGCKAENAAKQEAKAV